jgi:UDP-2,3-diacylglucosamine pyrophosphatase LpxH
MDRDEATSHAATITSSPLAFRTLFLSDLHLGSPDCQIHNLSLLLDNLSCEHLVLNGDVIDFWKMRRGGSWHEHHLAVGHRILRIMQERGMKVTYVRGNHDDLTSHLQGLKLENLQFVEQFVYHAAQGRYLVLHGDVFDAMVRHGGLPTWAADQAYNALLAVNRAYNWQRRKRGLEGFSIAGAIKRRVGTAMRFIERFEQCMADMAKSHNCDGVICGHIHVPADKLIQGVHYLNSGDWVENSTAIVESMDGRMSLATLPQLVQAGRLSPQTTICAEGNSRRSGHPIATLIHEQHASAALA